MARMHVRIDGVGFWNKGAELMLDAVVGRLAAEEGQYVPVWGGDPNASFEQLAARGILRPFILQRFRIPVHALARVLRVRGMARYGLVDRNRVDAVLDAGGFRFGDPWAHTDAQLKELAVTYRWLHRRGARLVFLPQAFGPFQVQTSKEAIAIATEHADLVFAREPESYEYLVDCLGKDDRIRCAPDFTGEVCGVISHRAYEKYAGATCVIPSSQVLKHAPSSVASAYVDFMVACVEQLKRVDPRVVVLNHGGGDDALLCSELAEKCGLASPVAGLTAREFKGILGCARAVLSSRYHGVASALSQGVPCLATSWSHKYELLFRDYGIEGGVIPVCDTAEVAKVLNPILDTMVLERTRSKLGNASAELHRATTRMWSSRSAD